MKFNQLRYTWIHGNNYAGTCSDGWGILQTSSQDESFLTPALEIVTNRSSSLDPAYTEYYEYQERYHTHVYLGVKKMESLAQMGGGDNNRLIQLYVPQCDSLLGMYQVDFEQYPKLEPGLVGTLDFPACDYVYHDILRKYQLTGSKEADSRLAVLIALLFLSFLSEEWKHVVIPVSEETGKLSDTAREITWLLGQLLPSEIFGMKRSELKKRLGYQVKGTPEGDTLVFMPKGITSGTLKEHYFSFVHVYDWERDISRNGMDRKVEGCGQLFYCLAKKAQKSSADMLQWLESFIKKGACLDIGSLNKLCDSSEVMKELLFDEPDACRRYLIAGLDMIGSLKRAGADSHIARQMLDGYMKDSILAKELQSEAATDSIRLQELDASLEQYYQKQYAAENSTTVTDSRQPENQRLEDTVELDYLFVDNNPQHTASSDTAKRLDALIDREKKEKEVKKKNDLISKLFGKKE